MPQLQLLKLLTFSMEVYPADRTTALVEADVVETLEASPCDRLHSMVWNEKILLPSHEEMLALVEAVQIR